MDVQRVDNLIAYALAVAGHEDFPCPELGDIHLIKYLYLVDLAYATKHHGQTFTGIDWKFHNYGPWNTEAWKRIDPVVTHVAARRKNISSSTYDDVIRYLLLKDTPRLERLDNTLPFEVTRVLKKLIHSFGSDTTGLLHHVYTTPPMLKAAPGDTLMFDAHDSATTPVPYEPARPIVSKIKKEEILARLRQRAQERAQTIAPSATVIEYTPPRYDEIYENGQAWLDSLSGGSVEPSRGTLAIDDSIWKTPGRYDPDIS